MYTGENLLCNIPSLHEFCWHIISSTFLPFLRAGSLLQLHLYGLEEDLLKLHENSFVLLDLKLFMVTETKAIFYPSVKVSFKSERRLSDLPS